MEQFIDRYIPIRIQSQISETLGAVLTRQLLTKLEHYEQAKYKELNEAVLNDAQASLDQGMKDMVNELVDYTQKFTMLSKKKSQQGPIHAESGRRKLAGASRLS